MSIFFSTRLPLAKRYENILCTVHTERPSHPFDRKRLFLWHTHTQQQQHQYIILRTKKIIEIKFRFNFSAISIFAFSILILCRSYTTLKLMFSIWKVPTFQSCALVHNFLPYLFIFYFMAQETHQCILRSESLSIHFVKREKKSDRENSSFKKFSIKCAQVCCVPMVAKSLSSLSFLSHVLQAQEWWCMESSCSGARADTFIQKHPIIRFHVYGNVIECLMPWKMMPMHSKWVSESERMRARARKRESIKMIKITKQ